MLFKCYSWGKMLLHFSASIGEQKEKQEMGFWASELFSMIWIKVVDCDKYVGFPSVNYSISNKTTLTAPVSYYAE